MHVGVCAHTHTQKHTPAFSLAHPLYVHTRVADGQGLVLLQGHLSAVRASGWRNQSNREARKEEELKTEKDIVHTPG